MFLFYFYFCVGVPDTFQSLVIARFFFSACIMFSFPFGDLLFSFCFLLCYQFSSFDLRFILMVVVGWVTDGGHGESGNSGEYGEIVEKQWLSSMAAGRELRVQVKYGQHWEVVVNYREEDKWEALAWIIENGHGRGIGSLSWEQPV
ncbi:hypothetical protein B0J18DRAFT_177786 [Chaetomium sp. MPI-SDFR-AT-0129]|nr:hypothetical protein B0J18DRAFT_177786 [Chaetomium sp. MPI-SDFR-AT-0129]